MINWADGPPTDANLPHLPLIRVATRGSIRGAITCTQILQVWTHFMSRRTQPCMRLDCPGCAASLPKRYEAYVGLITPGDRKHLICALTPAAAEQLHSFAPDPADLRGLVITLQRLGNRANGRLTCKIEQVDMSQVKLPPIPDLIAHMLRIWGLEQSHLGQDAEAYATNVRQQFQPNQHDHGA